MAIDLFGPGARLPAGGGVEIAGLHQWVKSLLVPPLFFALVAVVSALSGARDWLVVATVLSVLAIVFEALVLRSGVTSLVVSPVSVVRRDRRHTAHGTGGGCRRHRYTARNERPHHGCFVRQRQGWPGIAEGLPQPTGP